MKQIFNKYFWKEPIYKDDVLRVLGYGFLYAIIGGIVAGACDYLMGALGLPISFGLIIIVYFLSRKLSRSYYTYHILYPTLTILFMIVALFFQELTTISIVGGLQGLLSYLSDPMFYLVFIFRPILDLIMGIRGLDILVILVSIMNIMVYGWAFVYCFKSVKGRN